MEKIGITSTLPVEIIYAADKIPCDLNNIFITASNAQALVARAEKAGIPRNTCTWVKGIYGVLKQSNIKKVIAVLQGDCAHLKSMLEIFSSQEIEIIPLAFPYNKTKLKLRRELEALISHFNTTWSAVIKQKKRLDLIREIAFKLDTKAWQENTITSEQAFQALINCTDFKGDPEKFKRELIQLLKTPLEQAPEFKLRLGLLGVPPVFTNLNSFLEKHRAKIVFHELARQFAMPEYEQKIIPQYLNYTYPYTILDRVQDIILQSKLRKLDGYIHYVQSFCHHQLEDVVLRSKLKLPILTLEGDNLGEIDARTQTRLEAFIEMLKFSKGEQ